MFNCSSCIVSSTKKKRKECNRVVDAPNISYNIIYLKLIILSVKYLNKLMLHNEKIIIINKCKRSFYFRKKKYYRRIDDIA